MCNLVPATALTTQCVTQEICARSMLIPVIDVSEGDSDCTHVNVNKNVGDATEETTADNPAACTPTEVAAANL